MTTGQLNRVVQHLRKISFQHDGAGLTDGQLLGRFVENRDEAAVAALVRRHGNMVWAVCRRILRDRHDAEDSFQAAFLVLVRKAASIAPREMVANWLYGVARQTALNARSKKAKQRLREKQVSDMPAPAVRPELWDDLQPILDDELSRLPEKYRSAIVLCDLEGLTRKQAAAQLGCPEGTIASRLATARNRLAQRLRQRGVALTSGVLAAVLAEKTETACAPLAAIHSTIYAASLYVAGQAVASSVISAKVATLTEAVIRTMLLTKLKSMTMLLMMTALLGLTVGIGVYAGPAGSPTASNPREEVSVDILQSVASAVDKQFQVEGELVQPDPEEVDADADGKPRPFAGVVLDSQGKALAGVEVWLLHTLAAEGELFGHTRTDAAGAFRLEVPARWVCGGVLRQGLAVIAYQPQLGLTGVAYANISLPPKSGCKLVLAAGPGAELKFAKPDKTPAAEAKVKVTGLFLPSLRPDLGTPEEIRGFAGHSSTLVVETPSGPGLGRQEASLPAELRQKFQGTTKADGAITFVGLPLDLLGSFAIDAPGFGRQVGSLNRQIAETTKGELFPRPIVLAPVGSVTGRLSAPDAAAPPGSRIIVESRKLMQAGIRSAAFSLGGWAEARPDAEGRFTVPTIAADSLLVNVQLPPGSPYLVAQSGAFPKLAPGQTCQIDIQLQPACRVTGVLRAKDTGKPLEGVAYRLAAEPWDAGPDGYTDTKGVYTGYALAGRLQRRFSNPVGYLPPDISWNQDVAIAPGVKEMALPPLECDRPIDVRIGVVDQAGKPRARAVVRVTGTTFRGGTSYHMMKEWTVQTDERGEVVLELLDCRGPLTLEARDGAAFTAKTVAITDRKSQTIELRVGGGKGLSLAGRLVDNAGKPVVGAQVQVWSRCWFRRDNYGIEIHRPHVQTFDGGVQVRTDADGNYHTPAELFPGNEYAVQALASGMRSKRTDWLTAEAIEQTKGKIDLTAFRILALSGRVRDADGQAVAGARVLYTAPQALNVETRTSKDGSFQLAGANDAKGFVIVRQSGFRTQGKRLTSAEGAIDVVLARSDAASGQAPPTLPPPLSESKRRQLAAKLLEPLLQKALASKEDNQRFPPLEILAKLDPARVLGLLESRPFKDEWYDDSIRKQIVRKLHHESPDEALAIIESMHRAHARAAAYLEVANSLPAADKAARQRLLDQALIQARAESEAQYRVVEMASAARLCFDMGDAAAATKILRAAEADAKALPTTGWAAYARGCFAESLARIDVPAALALIADLKDSMEFDRHHNNIALILAATKPEESERALGKVQQAFQRENRMPYIAYRMARVDYARARRLVQDMNESMNKARALGLMAGALAEKDPPEATKVLREAFALLQRLVANGDARFNNLYDGSAVAGSLLAEVNRLSPRLVPEFLWDTVALRQPAEGRTVHDQQFRTDLTLALFLARYDRETARSLVEPWSHDAQIDANGAIYNLITAMAVIDPAWAMATIEHLPDPRTRDAVTERFLQILTATDAEFWNVAMSRTGLAFNDQEF